MSNTTENYDVVVIGAGIGGLSAGLHLVDKGYRTLILESHTRPGGLCTSFARDGFTFDTCIHWLVGCGEGGYMWYPLKRFGLLPRIKLRHLDRLMTIRTPHGAVTVDNDLGEFERFLCHLSPHDEKEIMGFFRQVKSLPTMLMPSKEDRIRHPLRTLGILLSYWPMLPLGWRWGKHTFGSFLQRFREGQKLRPFLAVGGDDLTVLISFYLYSWVHRQDLYAPQISSLEFSQAFETRFVEMGGKISYRSRVAKILVDGGKATGVRLEKGEEIRAKAVVSNADGYQTLFHLLGEEYVPDSLAQFYETSPLFGSMLMVSLGVGAVLSEKDTPARIVTEWVTTGVLGTGLTDLSRAPLSYKVESLYNPAVAPPGKGVILVEAEADYREWHDWRQDMGRYKEAKEKAKEIAVRRAGEYFPQIKGRVEVVDVATPVTFERYTANREGSIQGWRMTPQMMRRMNLPMRPTRMPNLFMVGQWVVVGGGIPTSVTGGAKVADMVEKYLRKR